ncbi:universal stress protein [Boseongicola aestuarii]|uniref:Universal stress protein family protein n=1 Tax=Boseongicola aestuarii TaxID=1470561 RepID=A0A238J6K0_9RHOB|nr:universal stress protein [Boseongicola aestuarii]SMX25765.1 Universal stress protein family protein [Boseongicola aestuarii]
MPTVPTDSHHTSAAWENGNNEVQKPLSEVIIGMRDPQSASQLMSHGMALANAFDGDVVLLHALQSHSNSAGPVDPVEWDIHRRDIEALLGACANRYEKPDRPIATHVLEGSCLEQIGAFIQARRKEVIVVLGEGQSLPHEDGKFAQAVLTSSQASILRVPSRSAHRKRSGYARILVPIDGSSRAESVLSCAVRLASAEKSEMILCFVTPPPGVADIGVGDDEAAALRKQVTDRNMRIGKSYLDGITDRLSGAGVVISTRTVVGEDARRSLLQVAKEQMADLIIIASHGQSGHCDVPAGDVASFILKRSGIPVLMLRQRMKPAEEHAYSGTTSEGVRKPAGLKP